MPLAWLRGRNPWGDLWPGWMWSRTEVEGKAECNIGHTNSFSTCEFFNKKRTSVLDIKISAMTLVVTSMTQECQQDFKLNFNTIFLTIGHQNPGSSIRTVHKNKYLLMGFWWSSSPSSTSLWPAFLCSTPYRESMSITLSTLTGCGYSRRSSELFKLRVSPFV